MAICITCTTEMRKTQVKYKGMNFEALQCPKCKQRIFTEELAMKAVAKMEAKRLQKEYIKSPLKIGHSMGMTFPKEMVEVFHLSSKSKVKMRPRPAEGKIELIVEQ